MKTSWLLARRRLIRHPPWASFVAIVVITFSLLTVLGIAHGLQARADRRQARLQEHGIEHEYYLDEGRLRVVIPTDAAFSVAGVRLGVGEMAVSPALASALEESPDGDLAARLPFEAVVRTPDRLMTHPEELLAVLGSHAVARSWEESLPEPPVMGVLILGAVMLAPLLMLLSIALRTDARQRERRHFMLSLMGASTVTNRCAGILETLVVSVGGCVAAVIIYLLALPLLSRLPVSGVPFFPQDVVPSIGGALVLMGAVLAVAWAVAWRTSRGRYRGGIHRQSVPDLMPWLIITGVALMLAATAAADALPEFMLGGLEAAGLVSVVVGIVREGSIIIQRTARVMVRSSRRSPAALIGLRRLESDPSSAYRAVVGLALVSFVVGFVSPLALPGSQNELLTSNAGGLLEIHADQEDPAPILATISRIEGATALPFAYAGGVRPSGVVTTCAGARWLLDGVLEECHPGSVLVDSLTSGSMEVSAVGSSPYADPTDQTAQFVEISATSSVVNALESDVVHVAVSPGQAFIALVAEDEIIDWPINQLYVYASSGQTGREVIKEVVTTSPGTLVGTTAQLRGEAASEAALRFAMQLLASRRC